MVPVGLDSRSNKGFILLHRCVRCGVIRKNRVADDPVQPDEIDVLVRLASGAGPL
jgi:hypothetical protein